MPVSTFRAWFIGTIWAILIPGLNQFFFFRYPSVTVGGVSVLIYGRVRMLSMGLGRS